ncbi:MAG TPA: VanZ family protein [bacterium]
MINQSLRKNVKYYCVNAPYLRPLVSVLFIYLILVYLLTLTPFHFSRFYLHQFLEFERGYFVAFIGGASVGDVVLNLFMLFPYGIVVGLITRLLSMKTKSAIVLAIASGLLISISIEFFQLFLPRTSSGVDIITNTIGAAWGAWFAYPVGKFDLQIVISNLYNKDQLFYVRLIVLCTLLATMILFIPVSVNTFQNWDSDYYLFVGNEATQNRPWNGEIRRIMIFDRTLKDNDIKKLYQAGYQNSSTENCMKELVIEYLFNNSQPKIMGKLKDRLHLFASKPFEAGQCKNNGFNFKNNIFLKSQAPASDLAELLKGTNQITLAGWIKPENLHQVGPARIISLSKDTDHRNFTLAQSGAMLNFRVRTPLTGLNGSEVELLTNQVLTVDEPQFVVATFHRGESKLYVNGERVAPIIYNTSFYLPLLISLGKNRFGKFAFCFILLFPMGWLARGLVHSRIWKSVASSLIVLIPFFIVSSFTAILFHHSFDLHLFYVCLLNACFVFFIGLFYDLAFRD